MLYAIIYSRISFITNYPYPIYSDIAIYTISLHMKDQETIE